MPCQQCNALQPLHPQTLLCFAAAAAALHRAAPCRVDGRGQTCQLTPCRGRPLLPRGPSRPRSGLSPSARSSLLPLILRSSSACAMYLANSQPRAPPPGVQAKSRLALAGIHGMVCISTMSLGSRSTSPVHPPFCFPPFPLLASSPLPHLTIPAIRYHPPLFPLHQPTPPPLGCSWCVSRRGFSTLYNCFLGIAFEAFVRSFNRVLHLRPSSRLDLSPCLPPIHTCLASITSLTVPCCSVSVSLFWPIASPPAATIFGRDTNARSLIANRHNTYQLGARVWNSPLLVQQHQTPTNHQSLPNQSLPRCSHALSFASRPPPRSRIPSPPPSAEAIGDVSPSTPARCGSGEVSGAASSSCLE